MVTSFDFVVAHSECFLDSSMLSLFDDFIMKYLARVSIWSISVRVYFSGSFSSLWVTAGSISW